MHKHLCHHANKIEIALSDTRFGLGESSVRHPQGDGFLNWLHVIFFGPRTGGELDSEWDRRVLENMAGPDLLSLTHSAAFAPPATASLFEDSQIPNQHLIFLVLYPARSHAYMVRPINVQRWHICKFRNKTISNAKKRLHEEKTKPVS